MTNHLVTRAGYGIFYGGQENGPFSNPSPGFNPPFYLQQTFQMTNCFDSSANPLQEDCSIPNFNVLSNGYPANSLSDPNNPSLYSLSPKLRTPYNQQWHFGLQYQLPAETVLEVSYAGSHGLKLYGFYNGNEAAPTPDTTAATAPRRPAHASLPGMGPCDLANSGNCNPVYDVSIPTFRSDDFSNYNSLQVRLQKRTSHGLEFEASYTYSHALDDASSANLGSQNQGDFRFQNNTGNWVMIKASASKGAVRFELWGSNPHWTVSIGQPVITNLVKTSQLTLPPISPILMEAVPCSTRRGRMW